MVSNPLNAEITADASDYLSSVTAAIGRTDELADEASSAERSLDSLAGETTQAALGLGALTTASAGASLSVGGLSSSVSSLGGVVGSAAVTVGALTATLGVLSAGAVGLTASLTALGAVAGGAAAALGAVGAVAGGIAFATVATQTKELAAAFKTAREGVLEAVEPIGEQFAPILVDLLERLPAVAEAVVDAIGPLEPFAEAFDDLGNAILDALPAVAAFTGDLARQTLPILRDFAGVAANLIPRAVRGALAVTRRLGPLFVDLGRAVIDAVPPLVDLGETILQVAVPAVTRLVDFVGDVTAAFNNLIPDLRAVIDSGFRGVFALLSVIARDAIDSVTTLLVGGDDSGGLIQSGIQTVASFLRGRGADLIQAGFKRLGSVAEEVLGQIRVTLVGEDGSGGLIQSGVQAIGSFLRGRGADLFRTGFNQIRQVTRQVLRQTRVALVGEDGSGGLLIGAIQTLGAFLRERGVGLIGSAFTAINDRLTFLARNLRIALVGEDGNSGILNSAIRQFAGFLQENATALVRRGFQAVGRAARTVATNLKIALVGESGTGGILNTILTEFVEFVQTQGPPLVRLAFQKVGSAIRAVALDIFNAITGNDDSILRSIISDFGSYLKTDAVSDLTTAATIAFDVLVAAAEGLYNGLVGNSILLDIFRDFATYMRNQAPALLRQAATTAFNSLVSAVKDAVGFLTGTGSGTLIGGIVSTLNSVKNKVLPNGGIGDRIRAAFATLMHNISVAFSIQEVVDSVGRALNNIKNKILPKGGVGDRIRAAFATLGNAIQDAFKSKLDGVVEFIDDLIGRVSDLIDKLNILDDRDGGGGGGDDPPEDDPPEDDPPEDDPPEDDPPEDDPPDDPPPDDPPPDDPPPTPPGPITPSPGGPSGAAVEVSMDGVETELREQRRVLERIADETGAEITIRDDSRFETVRR